MGGTVPWPQLLSLCELVRVYLYEKKSFIFANKDLLKNKASVLFSQVVNRAVNWHQRTDSVPSVTALGKSPAGTDPGKENHRGCVACINGQEARKREVLTSKCKFLVKFAGAKYLPVISYSRETLDQWSSIYLLSWF